jgi:hypothetical protein
MLPVLIAFAGVPIAASATGMLAGRCVRGPGMYFAVRTVAALSLMVALAAGGVGLATGFTSATFRAVEIGAQLIAPLWLTWGLIELVSSSAAVRFGARLSWGFALTVVPGLLLATDSLSAVLFSKAWPWPASISSRGRTMHCCWHRSSSLPARLPRWVSPGLGREASRSGCR